MSNETNPTLPLPGPELDRLIAAKLGYRWVMRVGGLGHEIWRWVKPDSEDNAFPARWSVETGLDQPEYSTDIKAAWGLVEYIRQHISKYVFIDAYDDYFLVLVRTVDHGHYILATGKADTAPHAICLVFMTLDLNRPEG